MSDFIKNVIAILRPGRRLHHIDRMRSTTRPVPRPINQKTAWKKRRSAGLNG